MSDDNLNEFARLSYSAGITPLAYAEHLVEMIIQVHRSVTFGRLLQECADAGDEVVVPMEVDDPGLSAGALASRIVGHLLDAGWLPPGGVL